LRIEVDAQASKADQIQFTPCGKTSLSHAGSCYFYQPALITSHGLSALGGMKTKTVTHNKQYLFHKFLM
jgi:hypothetical protein